jgi:multidrug transporter EmrE-like cation transporter
VTKTSYLLILASVSLSALAQIALKAGMASAAVQRATAGGPSVAAVLTVFLSPMVIFGLTLSFASAAVWLMVLAKVPVSSAYPFVALGFILTALLGRLVFDDPFTLGKIAGTALIVTGVVVMARG